VTAESGDRPDGLDNAFRAALLELEEYLGGVQPGRLDELVLPFATRWVLPQAGFDIAGLREEARAVVEATPLSERILAGYVDQVAWWVAQRMLLDELGGEDLDLARARLATVRIGIERRAATVEAAGFPRVAGGFRRVLEETEGGEPPSDRLWSALALRIAESVLR
jgi:hypothetical protein